jgi:hypothetical protein
MKIVTNCHVYLRNMGLGGWKLGINTFETLTSLV